MHASFLALLSTIGAASAVAVPELAARSYEGPSKNFTIEVSGSSYSGRNITQENTNATATDFLALDAIAGPAYLTGNDLPSNALLYQYLNSERYGAYIPLPSAKDDLSQVTGLNDTASFGWALDTTTQELTYHYEDTTGDFYVCKSTLDRVPVDVLKWGPTKNPTDTTCENVKLFAKYL